MSEKIVSHLGPFGRFHFALLVMLSMQMFLLAVNNLSNFFYHLMPPHHCQISEGEWLNQSLPAAEKPTKKQPYSSCKRYIDPLNHTAGQETCEEYEYDTSDSGWTVVSEFDLVCSWKYLPSLISSLYFCGMVIGSALFGNLADRFGRKPLILVGMYCQTAISLGMYFVNNVTLYIVLRTVLGALTDGIFGTSLTLLLEFSPSHLRGRVSNAFSGFWTLGAFYIGTIAYKVHDWRKVQLAISLPFIFSCIFLWSIPESVRWLISKNKTEEAKKTMKRFAKWNGREESKGIDEEIEEAVRENQKSTKKNVYSYLDLLKKKELRRRTLILVTNWFVMAMCYYGIIFNTGALTGNQFINFLIGIALEVLAYSITMTIVEKIKRKVFFLATIFLGGLLCISGVLIKRFTDGGSWETVALVCIMLSKAAVVATFVIHKAYTAELMPTVVRNMGMCACILTCRIGGLAAPQIVALGQYTDSLVPFLVFGILFLGGGSLGFMLPETKDCVIPETLNDVEIKESIDIDLIKKNPEKS